MSRASRLQRRTLLGLMAAGLTTSGAVAATAEEEAARFIARLGERALAILRRRDLDRAAKLAALEALVEQATDLELLARLVLGRYWRRATPEQQARFVALFRQLLRRGLARRLDDYSGQSFEVVGAEPVGRGDVLVHTRVLSPDASQPVAVSWRVRRRDGRLVIIDVIAEGVSLLITQRSEVAEVIGREGIEGLLRTLERRLREPEPAAAASPRPT